jgi:hypothetical protein
MNIFFLDENLTQSAKYHVDRHVVKQILEGAQIACSAYPQGTAPYRATHINHPDCQWARESLSNFKYVISYARALASEYTFRYGKVHKTVGVLDWLENNLPDIPDKGWTEPPRCFGELKSVIRESDSVVADYREYYRLGKSHLFSWTGRTKPDFLTQ